MREYEFTFVVQPEISDEGVQAISQRFEGILAQHQSEKLFYEDWGRRRLAYEIDHKAEGVYHLLTFDAEPEALAEVSRVLKITDGVMRHLAVRRVQGGSTRPPEPITEEPVAAAASARQDSGETESAREESE